jgi:serine protease Do
MPIGLHMSRILHSCALITLMLASRALFAAAPVAGLPDFTELVRGNSAAVVNISTTIKATGSQPGLPPGLSMPELPEDSPLNEFFRRFFGDHPPLGPGGSEQSSLGSGFIISKDGYVISNYHVVKDADEIMVKLSDRREFSAELIGTDPRSDIAVLKVKAAKDLPTLRIGDSDALEVGEWVLAIGSPFGFDHSVTAGIVSAKGRSLPNENYVPFIQTDVAINPGNSGGPLFNMDGEVVGVNSQIYSRTGGFMGLSFAIPIDVVLNVYRQLRDKGEVSRGWLGVLIQDVTRELAESFEMQKPEGALVSKVLADSPADKGGMEAGDVIVSFDDRKVATSADLPPIVGATPIGRAVPVDVMRAGKLKTLRVTIGELPSDDEAIVAEAGEPDESANKRISITVAALSESQREELEVEDHGVLVEDVQAGPAYDAGIRKGDVILQIDHQKIKDVAQFTTLVDDLKSDKPIPVLIQRQGGSQFLAMKVPEED